MKQTIRLNTFETNSSSTHSCIICSEEEYQKWNAGELFVDYHGNFHTKEELLKEFRDQNLEDADDEDAFEEFLSDEEYKTADQWFDCDLETDDEVREINGVKIHVCCKYGWDG